MLVVAIGAIAGLSVHRYVTLDRELTESALARRNAIATLAATTYSEKLDRLVDIGTALATRVRFQELVAAGRWTEAVQILRRVPQDFPFLDRVVITDRRGTAMADTPEAPGVRGTNFAERDWFKGVSRQWKPYVSVLYRRFAPPQRDVIAIAVPIHDGSGTVGGILVLQLKLDSFFDWAKQLDFGPEDRAMVVDADGRVAFDSQAVAGAVGAAPQVALPRVAGADYVRDAQGGEEQLRVYAPAAHGWGVIVVQSTRAAFAARDALLRQMLVDGALIALFAIAAILLGTRVLQQRRREEADRAHRLEQEQVRLALARQAERLRIVHEIDRAIIAEAGPEAIAAAVIEPLRELLGVPRAIVNLFDLPAGEVEWLAAAGRHRVRAGPGVRYSIRLMGDVEALRRGETQRISVRALPAGPDVDALLVSGVEHYAVVPMIAGGELIGAVSYGGEQDAFSEEQAAIAREVATQLAIAIAQARLFQRVQESEERYHTLFDTLLEGFCIIEVLFDADDRPVDYRFLEINAAFEAQTGMRDAQGKRMREFAPEHEEHWFQVYGKVARTGESVRFVNEAKALNRWYEVSAYRVGGADSRKVAVLFNDITEIKRAEAEIRALNASLEKRVADRTAQLEAANQELESFSYSVSHDLRAPLRAIDGFSLMLEEDYAGRLDDEGRRLLAVVRGNARRMGALIDDLLAFSRVSRTEPLRLPVDMGGLAREVAREVSTGASPPVEIEALPPAQGDRALLKQVWVNLLANACKFSAKRELPRVRVGGKANGTELVYWVRDNGAGFDPRYAGKLFGVFQRLHRDDEFPGTGVGLAIVQRVVSRHGGRVWAEGELGKGACFYFTLPKEA